MTPIDLTMFQVFSPQRYRNKTPSETSHSFLQEVCLCFGKSYFKEYHRLGASETLRTRLRNKIVTNIFFMIKKFFWQNEYKFKKDLYLICNTKIFCIKIYF